MKVLLLLPTLNTGGSEKYVLRFVQYLQEHPIEITVWSVNPNRGDLHKKFEETGSQIYYGAIGYYNPIRFYDFYQFLRKKKFDVICTFNGNFGGIPLFLAKMAGVPKRIAWHRRSTNAFQESILKVYYNSFVNRLIRKYATKILSNSRFALDNFYRDYWSSDDRFKIIRNGLDTKSFSLEITQAEARQRLGLPINKFIIGHVGRYAPAKNHETIFRIASIVKAKNQEIHFIFCGKGTDDEPFLEKLEIYDIASNCSTMGLVEEVSLMYSSFDLFLFPSITEGQPNALIEAMVSGVPILTSNIPPIFEILPDVIANRMPSPLDHNAFANMILQFEENSSMLNLFRCSTFAKNNFDGKENFELFKKELY